MKNLQVRILLIILTLISLFTCISINQNLFFLYEYSFVDGPKMLLKELKYNNIQWTMTIHWILLLIASIGMILLQFIYNINIKYKLTFYIPLVFITLQSLFLIIFAFILIPFTVVWLVALNIFKKESSLKINSMEK
ncbi:hypothetical protein [Pedobacter jejuensis]|uniref:DUF4293 family protein n=1 Tax=Pedobacter jejuensis TaxID=1268550 RepID=A0A3N0BZK5_9SPHI|nr:hypothetical protein [Pedobacter jejuensis]RNL54724.1 hypothetical protein D7004_06240 [Pedobacter jejuensis]